MKFKVYINNIDYTKYVPLPFDIQQALDESLDLGYLKLNYLDKKTPFSPLDSVVIWVGDEFNNIKEFSFFVSNDTVVEIISQKKYIHELSLIEQTKWLERFTGIVKTNTTPIFKDYTSAQQPIPIMVKTETGYESRFSYGGKEYTSADFTINPYPSYLKTPYTMGILFAPSFKNFMKDIFKVNDETYDSSIANTFIRVDILLNDVVYKTYTQPTYSVEVQGMPYGKWEVQYWYKESSRTICLSMTMGAVNKNAPTIFTITDVINNVLQTCECLYEDEAPRFVFNELQSVEYSSIEAPDFSLKGTLWEALNEVGSFIHAIPRLHNNIVYFDKLGSSQETNVNLSNYCSNTTKFDIEQFVTAIDSTVDNIVNVDDKNQGSIIAPFNKGLKTVRSETGVVQLTYDNIIIETREKIEEIISVECGYISNGQYVGDITPYIFESAEYNALSSLGGQFPTSRAYALVYTQGQKNISGLNFKIPNAVSSVFSQPAIINIIARKLNINPLSIANENLMNLQFKIKYIPIISARIKQSKNNIEDIVYVSNLDFNQTSNKINSFAYGENMKGTIAKLGNPEITKMFLFNNLNNIPNIGDLFNEDYYISIVKTEFYKELFKCEIGLSKNFNKLNEYVGIKSQKRFYEISEKQSVDRYIIFEDFCIIGDSYSESDNKSLITENGIIKFIQQFTKDETSGNIIDVVKCEGQSELQKALQKVLLPVNSLGIGNSIIFNFHYDDNYSAGNTRVERDNTKMQYQVQYTDIYGRVDSLNLNLGVGNSGVTNYSSAISEGNLLPKTNSALDNITTYFATSQNIVIKKDNRENIHFTYQINFITNNKSFVLGTGLTRKSTFVTSDLRKCKIYVLPTKLSKFNNFIDLSEATLISDTIKDINYTISKCSLPSFTSTVQGKSWVIVTDKNELILGQNKNIKANDVIPATCFTFSHKII